MISIRPIREPDLAACVDMGSRMHGESGYRDFPYNPDKVRLHILHIVSSPDMLGLVALNDSGKIIGMFLGGCRVMPFFDAVSAGDLVLYVDKDHRGSSAGARLVRAYVEWAGEKGVDMITIANSTEINTERVGRFYERMGFERIGYVFKFSNFPIFQQGGD